MYGVSITNTPYIVYRVASGIRLKLAKNNITSMYSHRSILKFGSPDAATDLSRLLKDGYDILTCRFSIQQGTGQNGKITTRVFVSAIEVNLSQFPTIELLEWGLQSRRYIDGVIVVLNEENIPVEKIIFKNAACTKFEIDYVHSGKSYLSTKLALQAEELIVGGDVRITNEWIYD